MNPLYVLWVIMLTMYTIVTGKAEIWVEVFSNMTDRRGAQK